MFSHALYSSAARVLERAQFRVANSTTSKNFPNFWSNVRFRRTYCGSVLQYTKRTERQQGRSMDEENVRGLTDEEANQCCHPRTEETKLVMKGGVIVMYVVFHPTDSGQEKTRFLANDFFFQQTMIRIKDAKKSLDFYTKVLGMSMLCKLDFAGGPNFSLYFMGYADPANAPKDPSARRVWALSQPGTLELTHNWGTENDPDQKYHNGNTEPRGYGHIGIAVKDVYASSERFEKLGVEFVKKPDDGRMKGLAFIKDPDGYWIEIFKPDTIT